MAPHILPRQENPATTNNIAGGLIAGFVGLVLLCLLYLLRLHRSKANKQRTAEQSAAPFRVRGGLGVRPTMTETHPLSIGIPHFSRRGLTASIVMPQKCVSRGPSSHGLSDKAVVSSKLEPSPVSSTPSRYRPLSNIPSRSRPRSMSILNPACPRHSRSSSGFNTYAQNSFPAGFSSRPCSAISTPSTQARPVRQPFVEPILPDELSFVRYGEYLTVLRSFDDGWCLVARDRSRRASRLSSWMKSSGDDVDIGLVPAWVFVKPLKGVTAARPFRSASVNALHLDQNSDPARDAIISWSNFA